VLCSEGNGADPHLSRRDGAGSGGVDKLNRHVWTCPDRPDLSTGTLGRTAPVPHSGGRGRHRRHRLRADHRVDSSVCLGARQAQRTRCHWRIPDDFRLPEVTGLLLVAALGPRLPRRRRNGPLGARFAAFGHTLHGSARFNIRLAGDLSDAPATPLPPGIGGGSLLLGAPVVVRLPCSRAKPAAVLEPRTIETEPGRE
jgi:hypothetical protein